jgi:hypothetical protein
VGCTGSTPIASDFLAPGGRDVLDAMTTAVSVTAAGGWLAALLALGACAAAPGPAGPGPGAATPSAAVGAPHRIQGAVVRFTAGSYSLDATIGADSPAVRDFLSMLPLRLPFEELSGREKIAYLPRKLKTDGSPGSDPQDGDLIYYAPWGNLGFYYNAAGIGYSDDTLHIGRYNATAGQLEQLQNGPVTVTLVG